MTKFSSPKNQTTKPAGMSIMPAVNDDVLNSYIRKISKIPVLGAAEEKELAKRAKEGDIDARRKLVQSNLRLVVNITKKTVQVTTLPMIDLIQEGNLGLMIAVEKFDYTLGYRFSTYAAWWIKQSVFKAISEQSRCVKIPVYIQETLSKFSKIKAELEQKYNTSVKNEEVAKKMNVAPEKIDAFLSAFNKSVSIDAQYELQGGSEVTLADVLVDEKADVFSSIENEGLKKDLELPPYQRNFVWSEEQVKEFVNGLSFKVKGAVDMYWDSFSKFGIGHGTYNYNRETRKYALQNATYYAPSYRSVQNGVKGKEYLELSFNYLREFGSHHLSGILLANLSSNRQPSTANSDFGNIPQIYQGIVARVNYDYADKYLVEINAGYNGSNRFAKGRRYAFFPAASIGWVISEESFLKNSEVISFLKIRASAGQVGNDKMGSFNYYYDDLWASAGSNYEGYYSFGNENPINFPIMIETRIGNDNITWERATKYNIGIESKWFRRLSVSGDFFYEYRKDIIRPMSSIPGVSGIIGASPMNIGVIDNRGFEMEVKWIDNIGEFHYNVDLMYSYARNRIIENGDVPSEYSYQDRRGRPMGTPYLYQVTGLFNSWEEIGASAYQDGAIPGSVKFLDANGDGLINEYH